MVHLAAVKNDSEIQQQKLVHGMEELDLSVNQGEFTESVYGSKFAATDIPKHEMPEDEMPSKIAYRLMK